MSFQMTIQIAYAHDAREPELGPSGNMRSLEWLLQKGGAGLKSELEPWGQHGGVGPDV